MHACCASHTRRARARQGRVHGRQALRQPLHAAHVPLAPPAPRAQIPLLGGLVDTYSLWLSTRNAFLAWAMMGCRPPLYLAVPCQLAALLRISRAGFCTSAVLRHPLMQQRTGGAGRWEGRCGEGVPCT
jgi:hypothetical protein